MVSKKDPKARGDIHPSSIPCVSQRKSKGRWGLPNSELVSAEATQVKMPFCALDELWP